MHYKVATLSIYIQSARIESTLKIFLKMWIKNMELINTTDNMYFIDNIKEEQYLHI